MDNGLSVITHTKVFHPHPQAGVEAGFLRRLVAVVPWPQFVGEPKVLSWYPTLPDGFTQFLLTAVAFCCVNVAYTALSECIHNGVMRVSSIM